MAQTVVGIFETHGAAVQGVDALRAAGFGPRQISIIAPDPREAEGFGDEVGVRVLEASAAGVAAGGLLGGVGGWLVGLAGLAIPGAGLLLAAGPVAAALVGAVGGASVGGFLGMLVGLGLPHHAAQEYERALREGRTLVIVHPDGRYFEAEAALNHAHPSGLHRYDEPIGAAAHPPADVAEGGIELAAPDRSLNPGDVAVAIEGQQVMGHGQYQDAADLHNPSGAKDT